MCLSACARTHQQTVKMLVAEEQNECSEIGRGVACWRKTCVVTNVGMCDYHCLTRCLHTIDNDSCESCLKPVAHGEIKQSCQRSGLYISFQPIVDSFVSGCANAKTVSGCFSVLFQFQGCADA